MGVAIGRCPPGQSPLGGDAVGPNPTDRAKNGTKTSLLAEGRGGPLSVVVAPANVHDTKLLDETLEAAVVDRPKPTSKKPQNLCLDKAYDNLIGEITVLKHRYVGHIRRIGEENSPGGAKRRKKFPSRRWVVERTLAWLSKCRGLLVRYEKKAENYVGLLSLACSLLWYRRTVFHSF